jgi:hypothetical protein
MCLEHGQAFNKSLACMFRASLNGHCPASLRCDNKLSFSKESSSESVCDACQCAKSHQLPFSRSFSVSKAPLELVFSDVWGGLSLILLAIINTT